MKRSDLVKKLEQFSTEFEIIEHKIVMTDGEGTMVTIEGELVVPEGNTRSIFIIDDNEEQAEYSQ